MTRTRYKIYDTIYPHFLTCTVVGWLPIFTRRETVEIILNSWRFLQENDRLTLYGYVILENHLHLIASAEDLPRQIAKLSRSRLGELLTYWRHERWTCSCGNWSG